MSENCKATFVLPLTLLNQVRAAVSGGLAESASALVRESLEARLRELREAELAREFREAAEDPLFLEDLLSAESDFEGTLADGLP